MSDGNKWSDRSKVPRRAFLASSGVTAAGLLAGCSGGGSGGGGDGESGSSDGGGGSGGGSSGDGGGEEMTETEASGTDMQSVKFAASHYPVVPSSLIFPVADQQGFYEQEGIKMQDVTSFAGGGTTIRGVVTGDIPVGGGSGAGVINAFTSGAPVHMIGNIDEPPPIDVVAPADSGIESIQDLAGKTVGFTNPGSVSQQLLAGSISRADGISLEDVTLKAMGGLGETISGINEGIIDAGWSNITVSIPRVEKGEWKRIYGTWEYIKIPNLVLLAGQRTINQQPELLQGIVNAHIKAGEFYRNNTGEVAKLWANTWDNIDQELAKQVLDKKLEISDVGVWTVGFRKSTLQQLEEAMQLSGLLGSDQSAPLKKIIDQRFLPDDEKISI